MEREVGPHVRRKNDLSLSHTQPRSRYPPRHIAFERCCHNGILHSHDSSAVPWRRRCRKKKNHRPRQPEDAPGVPTLQASQASHEWSVASTHCPLAVLRLADAARLRPEGVSSAASPNRTPAVWVAMFIVGLGKFCRQASNRCVISLEAFTLHRRSEAALAGVPQR